jgi:hypothetical protein
MRWRHKKQPTQLNTKMRQPNAPQIQELQSKTSHSNKLVTLTSWMVNLKISPSCKARVAHFIAPTNDKEVHGCFTKLQTRHTHSKLAKSNMAQNIQDRLLSSHLIQIESIITFEPALTRHKEGTWPILSVIWLQLWDRLTTWVYKKLKMSRTLSRVGLALCKFSQKEIPEFLEMGSNDDIQFI